MSAPAEAPSLKRTPLYPLHREPGAKLIDLGAHDTLRLEAKMALYGNDIDAAETPAGPGVVTSGTHSPTLRRPIGLALLPAGASAVGTEFCVEIRGRQARARVVETPFYKRKKEVPA
jgi:glycine cleavage system aminomethyltransferase T